nr:lmo0937 family membrane protein [Rhodocyclus tenuis]
MGHSARRDGSKGRVPYYPRRSIVLYTIAIVMIILWLLGMVSSYTMGGLIHILLVIAIIVVLLNIIQGRRPL